ncbi:MAG: peptide chain release factor N(5)-glutamine methyltransferase [Clostridiales bacterium]|nr:peptide chain release factor N(5)-glutamine methyltransferase [Clostridiales bacterium]
MTLSEYLEEKTTLLSRAGIPDAENEAWLCFMEGTGLSRSVIRFSLGNALSSVVSESSFGALEEIFARRAEHEPLSYIVGHAPFYDLTFSVGEGVLIPRFDTEILVETALGALSFPQMLPGAPQIPQVDGASAPPQIPQMDGASAPPQMESHGGTERENRGDVVESRAVTITDVATPIRILDLCTGSGCVGITIAHELQKKGLAYDLVMTEISPKASAFAEENAKAILGEGSWKVELADLWPESEDKYDLIVSNPPYVTKEEMTELLPEVSEYEPAMALTDEGDGLLFYRRIVEGLPRFLAPGGVLAVEHGCDQGEAVRDLMRPCLSGMLTVQDYGGRDRVTCGKCAASSSAGAGD